MIAYACLNVAIFLKLSSLLDWEKLAITAESQATFFFSIPSSEVGEEKSMLTSLDSV